MIPEYLFAGPVGEPGPDQRSRRAILIGSRPTISFSMDQQKRADLFRTLCLRNQLRKAHGLPLINVREEYERAVQIAWRNEVYVPCRQQVRDEILAQQREKFGPHWGHSFGARWVLHAMVDKVMRQRFGWRS
jgi:hypothetical protein